MPESKLAGKSVSIPERAREIAAEIHLQHCSYWTHDGGWCDEDKKRLTAEIAEAMHSERELCAKELEEMGKNGIGLTEALILREAAKLLREGGQK